MIEHCPKCSYRTEGVPAKHPCPECGYQFDRTGDVVQDSRTGRTLGPWVGATAIIAGVFMHTKGYSSREVFLLLLLAGAAVIASSVFPGRTMESFILICDETVRIVDRAGREKTIPTGSIGSARWSWVDGNVYIYDQDGHKLTAIRVGFLRSHSHMQQAARLINARIKPPAA